MNAAAGSIGEAHAREREAAIRDAFDQAGVTVEIHAVPGPRLADTARAAARTRVDGVVAAGGDGTVSAVASALAGGDMPMAVLPLGTLNHFARDLGMPKDLGEAARAIAAGTHARVDVGEVNGRVFVNNSSIGLYPLVVRARVAEQKATGKGKWRAMATAIWRVLRRFPLVSVLLKRDDGSSIVTRTPFVFIGNNAYQVSPLALGRRNALDDGHLCLYTMRCQRRWKLLWLALRAIFQDAETVEDVEVASVDELEVVLPRGRVHVAADGEVLTLSSPLRYRVRAGALPVIRPATAEELAPQARDRVATAREVAA